MFTLQNLLNAWNESGKFCVSYAGPHYDDPSVHVWTGDWNNKRFDKNRKLWHKFCDRAESQGISLRFSDEITTDEQCRAHEDIPGYHGESPSYCIRDDATIWARDEAEADPDAFIEACLSGEGALQIAGCKLGTSIPTGWSINLGEHGFTLFDYEAESGFHPGQTDTPESVVAKFQKIHGGGFEIIPVIGDVGQFDVRWTLWYRIPEGAVEAAGFSWEFKP